MRLRFATALSAVLLTCPARAASDQPISNWGIEPSDARCVAVRQFGSVNKPTILALKASPYADVIQIAILRAGLRRGYLQSKATVDTDSKDYVTTALSYPLDGDRRRVAHLISLDAETSAALRTTRTLQTTIVEGTRETFDMGQMASLWKNLDDCVSSLRRHWNIGENAESIMSEPPRGNMQALFSPEDYPVRAILADESGATRIGLLIDKNGRVRDCTLLETSGIAMLDSRSCGIITQRAKFVPATDDKGKPMRSPWVQTIRWSLAGSRG